MKPFEGIFGNNCELRMIEYLLPLEGIEFNITELAAEVGVSRPSVIKAVKIFVEWGLINSRSEKNVTYYSINPESPIVKNILQLNNLIIEKILGEEALYEIHDYFESKKTLVEQNAAGSCFEIEPNASIWINDSQSAFKKSQLWQEKEPTIKHHHFCSETGERSIYKSIKHAVTT